LQGGLANGDKVTSHSSSIGLKEVQIMSVILYEHIDFRGSHKHVVNRNEDNLHRDGWGDRVSSIQVLPASGISLSMSMAAAAGSTSAPAATAGSRQ
jgi:hypothetical protein